ncbi:MAG: DUF192 domain-containing protein [Minisyncoccia bacterium]
MKSKKIYTIVLIVLLVIVGSLELKHLGFFSKQNIKISNNLFFIHPIRVGSAFFSTAFAISESERTIGLSGTNKLEPNQGLLFVFPENDYWGIWMKDMKYPIDIIWLTEKGEVSYIKQNVSPDTYPEVFYPPVLERYVLELPAGTVEALKIEFGDLLLY